MLLVAALLEDNDDLPSWTHTDTPTHPHTFGRAVKPFPSGARRPNGQKRRVKHSAVLGGNDGRVSYLFGKDGDVLVERLGRADVTAGHAGFPRRARGQFAFFEYQRQQREQRMPVHSKQQQQQQQQQQQSVRGYVHGATGATPPGVDTGHHRRRKSPASPWRPGHEQTNKKEGKKKRRRATRNKFHFYNAIWHIKDGL